MVLFDKNIYIKNQTSLVNFCLFLLTLHQTFQFKEIEEIFLYKSNLNKLFEIIQTTEILHTIETSQ